MLLKNKTALVTGATRGIGRAIALKMAESGANVAFTFLSSEEKAKALEKELEGYGIKAKGYKSDASSKGCSSARVEELLSCGRTTYVQETRYASRGPAAAAPYISTTPLLKLSPK